MVRRKIISIWSVLLILVLALAVFVPGCNGTPPTTGTIDVDATLDGSPWPSSGTGAVEYTLTVAGGSPTNGSEVPKTFTDMDAGDWTCAYVSGGPGTFVDITTAATQNLAAGGTITFTLNFVTPATPMDASVTFKSWTLNGVPIDPAVTWVFVYPGDWIDVEYEEHVSGEEDAHVNVHQTSWLQVHNIGPFGEAQGPPVNLHVVNAPGAVSMDPPADVSNQQATVEGVPVQPCALVPLPYCEPVTLDAEVDLELVVCNNYTKTINWIGFNPPGAGPMILFGGPPVLFESHDDFYDNVSFNLTAKACLEPGEGFEDTNPSNDCTDWSPTLTITFNPTII
jgi:hypothetical protein